MAPYVESSPPSPSSPPHKRRTKADVAAMLIIMMNSQHMRSFSCTFIVASCMTANACTPLLYASLDLG